MIDEAQPFETEMIGKVEAVIYHTILTYNLKRHPNCGYKEQIVKNGTKTTRILLPNNNRRISHLDLKSNNFFVKSVEQQLVQLPTWSNVPAGLAKMSSIQLTWRQCAIVH